MTTSNQTLNRLPQVLARTGLCKSKIYKLIAEGGFPAPVKLGRASAWIESEVDAWIHARIAETRGIAA